KSDILFTHTPPDMSNSDLVVGNFPDMAVFKREMDGGIEGIGPAYENEEGAIKSHVGNKDVRNLIKRSKMKVVFCGHIHEGSGAAYLKNTLVINPGSKAAYRNKRKVTPFVLLTIDKDFSEAKFLLRSWKGKFKKVVPL
ncbi:MAG: metallophosphoesterase family protein, partial [Candidatus Aenigmarchaeota archaeon]|nr:metallophosphoesterase family protein [Candidatus Aenigmarchaeota archaeon]